jgi:hypothetical protein
MKSNLSLDRLLVHRMRQGVALLVVLCMAFLVLGLEGVVAQASSGATVASEAEPVIIYYSIWLPHTVGLVPVHVRPPVGVQQPLPLWALQLLIDGPPAGSGLSRTLPQETQVLALDVVDGQATVDFSGEIMNNSYGSSGEALMLGSIVNTLTAFPEIDSVWILVDGQPPGSLGGHIDISEPLPYNPHSVYRRGLPDVTGHWAEGHITAFCLTGIISGYPEGDFRPEQTVTREEFIKMLVLTQGLSPLTPTSQATFADVPSDRWSSGHIEAAVAAGIIVASDYGQNLGPAVPPSRREMAVMLVRATGNEALAESLRDAPLNYTDTADLPPWARGYVAAVTQLGLMRGYPDGTFMPQATVKRSEAVTTLSRLTSLSEGRVVIVLPGTGQLVGGQILVLGAAQVFEATVMVRVKSPDGTLFAETYATATDGGPNWGVFGAILPAPVTAADEVFTVEAYESSAEDGSEVQLTSRQVKRAP